MMLLGAQACVGGAGGLWISIVSLFRNMWLCAEYLAQPMLRVPWNTVDDEYNVGDDAYNDVTSIQEHKSTVVIGILRHRKGSTTTASRIRRNGEGNTLKHNTNESRGRCQCSSRAVTRLVLVGAQRVTARHRFLMMFRKWHVEKIKQAESWRRGADASGNKSNTHEYVILDDVGFGDCRIPHHWAGAVSITCVFWEEYFSWISRCTPTERASNEWF